MQVARTKTAQKAVELLRASNKREINVIYFEPLSCKRAAMDGSGAPNLTFEARSARRMHAPSGSLQATSTCRAPLASKRGGGTRLAEALTRSESPRESLALSMRSLAARAPDPSAGGSGRRHEHTVRMGAQPKFPMAQAREVVASEIRKRIDPLLCSVRYDGGRSAGQRLGAEIQRPAAFTRRRAGMAIADAKARGRSPCGAETRQRERDAEFDLAHENAPVSS